MNKISKWLGNGRYGSLVQSLMPTFLAIVFAAGSDDFNILLSVLAVLGVSCAHISLNLADDYFDYKVDMSGDRERVIRKGFRAMTAKYPYLTDGSETPGSLMRAIVAFGAVALACGVVVFVFRVSWWIPAIVSATAFMGWFYSAPPFKLAFRGLGELVIGVIFGPLLMMGAFYAASGTMHPSILWISIPVGLLVLNILFTHSFIDMKGDAESNKMTFARLLGSEKTCLVASWLFSLLPFVMVVVSVAIGALQPLYLVVLFVLPRALWLCNSLLKFTKGEVEVPSTPPAMLGKMLSNWDAVREAGIDWFLMRWLAARNLLSGFCFAIMIAKIILLCVR